MFKNLDKWFGAINQAFSNMDNSIEEAGDAIENYMLKRTDDLTPTLSHTLKNSRNFYQNLDSDSLEIVFTYNENGTADYAIEQHEGAPTRTSPYYHHDYPHNPAEAQTFTGQEPLRYLSIPLMDERGQWSNKLRKVGWK